MSYVYFLLATQSPDLVKKVFNARDSNPDLPNPSEYNVFVTLGPGLENTLEHIVAGLEDGLVDPSCPLYLSTDILPDTQSVLAALRRVDSFMIWRGGEQEEVNEKEVTICNEILSMLASKDARGKLTKVCMPKVNHRQPHFLIYSDSPEPFHGLGEGRGGGGGKGSC